MTELTANKIRLVMLSIRAARLRGEIGENEPISTERMARISEELGCPVAEITFRRAADRQIALARLALERVLQGQAQNLRKEIRNEGNAP